ncbi:hypothetical protein EC968_009643, partial [Mortierella alpina]
LEQPTDVPAPAEAVCKKPEELDDERDESAISKKRRTRSGNHKVTPIQEDLKESGNAKKERDRQGEVKGDTLKRSKDKEIRTKGSKAKESRSKVQEGKVKTVKEHKTERGKVKDVPVKKGKAKEVNIKEQKVKEGKAKDVAVKEHSAKEGKVKGIKAVETHLGSPPVYKPKEGMSDICRVFKCIVCHGLPASSKTRCLSFSDSAETVHGLKPESVKGKRVRAEVTDGNRMEHRKGKSADTADGRVTESIKGKNGSTMEDRKRKGVEGRNEVEVSQRQERPCDVMTECCWEFKCPVCWGIDPTALCYTLGPWNGVKTINLEEELQKQKDHDRHLDGLLDDDLGNEDDLDRILKEEWGWEEENLSVLRSDTIAIELSSDRSSDAASDEDEEDVWFDAEGLHAEDPHTGARMDDGPYIPEDDFEGLVIPFDDDFDAEFYRNSQAGDTAKFGQVGKMLGSLRSLLH